MIYFNSKVPLFIVVHGNSLEMKSVVVLYIVVLIQPILLEKVVEEKSDRG